MHLHETVERVAGAVLQRHFDTHSVRSHHNAAARACSVRRPARAQVWAERGIERAARAQHQHQHAGDHDADEVDRELERGFRGHVPVADGWPPRRRNPRRAPCHRDEDADEGGRLRRHQRQHARRAGQQRHHERQRADLEDEVHLVDVFDAVQGEPAGRFGRPSCQRGDRPSPAGSRRAGPAPPAGPGPAGAAPAPPTARPADRTPGRAPWRRPRSRSSR